MQIAKDIKRLAAVFLMAALLFVAPLALAEQAENITDQFKIGGKSKYSTSRLCDGSFLSKWTGNEIKNPCLTFTSKTDEKAYGIYLCFAKMPDNWQLQTKNAQGEWETLFQGDTRFLHTYAALPGLSEFRLMVSSDKPCSLEINELSLYSQGDLPENVQLWESTPEKADMLVLVAHPDDELIMMGGIVPTYAAQKGMDVVVAYMTVSNTSRSSELLNGLWSMGCRSYPVLGAFGDSYTSTLEKAYQVWNAKAVREFTMMLVRRFRPEVMVTHAIDGEYGHGAHRVCADMAIACVEDGDNEAIEPALYETYGGWQPKKLYLHLYAENQIRLDWRVPLEKLGGRTALEAAQQAYQLHVTQQRTAFTVSDEGAYDNASFGLYYSSVGPDMNRNDLMENIPGKGEITYTAPAPTPVPKVEAAAADQAAHPAWSAVWPDQAGQRNAKGFLLQGEYILSDAESGLWFYASESLIVRVDRFRDEKARRTWYEAHMYVDLQSGERVQSVQYTPEKPGKKRVQITKVARENQVVFGMSTDYYTYRVGDPIVGIVIRDGQILHDSPPKRNRSKFPNLDVLAMFKDGDWRVFHSDEYTAQEYLDMGAVNVYSFGPFLVRDGELNPFLEEMYAGKTDQPRYALGMIEKGHYFAMLEEGRFSKTAKGTSVKALAEHMLEKGCVQALNMDGGQTSVFTFMGEQITRIAAYGDDRSTLPRATSELIAAGFSRAIDPLE